ncbi:hypothetical protein D3C84_1291010 [compost metagenome]
MKSFNSSNLYQKDKQASEGCAKGSNVVGFSSFKERKDKEEYKKALNEILSRARKVDW